LGIVVAGSAVVVDDALWEGPQATMRPPPLVGSSACRLRSPPKGTDVRRLDARRQAASWAAPPLLLTLYHTLMAASALSLSLSLSL
jgi:hypothetical protein